MKSTSKRKSATKKAKDAPAVSTVAETLFEKVSMTFLGDPRISPSRMFGATGLMVGGKAFAMVYKGNLVVKLPKERVDALVSSGVGTRFEPSMGRTMKEWLAVPPGWKSQWVELSEEARDFVTGAGR